ncbi:hypothetical protein EUZ85_04070 [Hahella sp. KA22]|uniref:hypothetical protein n=1 Tax=Hahella sp. KA22 TaxID=1628392 RepID=UPI000FDD7089|nr:hypothetical protein [Hahella sp. KA22]AZZ89926.1 hypothetical protein ENC22_01525 [Hahella sp. KA22]QAY53295.1 hypothetical protein EUZ85_04070 [Hahella sp. KA22]
MTRSLCFLLLTFIVRSALAETTGIPASVSQVQTKIVNGQVVRIVQHNMEINPIIQFEILSRPDFEPLQTLTVGELPYRVETLSLRDSSGAFVEKVIVGDTHISIVFEYFFIEGQSALFECQLPVSGKHFGSFQCSKE